MVNVAKQVVRTSLNLTDQDVLGIDCWSHVTGLASQIAAEGYKVGAEAQVTPQRARKYGVNFAKWKRIINASLGADLKPIAAHGRLVSKKLGGASDVQISGEGTDLSVSLRGREAILEDGIVDANDIARGHLQSSLPSGFVDIAPLETTGDGDVTFPSTPLWGKMIRNLRFTFSGGRLVDYKADKNVEAFANYFKASSGEKDRIGSLTIGLNPRASYLGGFVDHFVAGAVTIGLGGNQDIGGGHPGPLRLRAAVQKGQGAAGRKRGRPGGELLK